MELSRSSARQSQPNVYIPNRTRTGQVLPDPMTLMYAESDTYSQEQEQNHKQSIISTSTKQQAHRIYPRPPYGKVSSTISRVNEPVEKLTHYNCGDRDPVDRYRRYDTHVDCPAGLFSSRRKPTPRWVQLSSGGGSGIDAPLCCHSWRGMYTCTPYPCTEHM